MHARVCDSLPFSCIRFLFAISILPSNRNFSSTQLLLRRLGQPLDGHGRLRRRHVLQWHGRLVDGRHRHVSRWLLLPHRHVRAADLLGRLLLPLWASVQHDEAVRGLVLSAGPVGIDRRRTVSRRHLLSFGRHDGRARAVYGRLCVRGPRNGEPGDRVRRRFSLPDRHQRLESAVQRVSGWILLPGIPGNQRRAHAVYGRLVL